MSKTDNGGPAFPKDLRGRRGDNPEPPGMTLRDWFAGMALQGLNVYGYGDSPEDLARLAWKDADAMLAARKGGES